MKNLLAILTIFLMGIFCQAQTYTITTVAGNGTAGYSGDGGAATSAAIKLPSGVFADASGNIYIADSYNSRIRKVNSGGNISTIAGSGIQGYSGDGAAATLAELNGSAGIYLSGGNVYIADYANERVREVNNAGIISTFAGTGTPGYSGDGSQATLAELWTVNGVAVDQSGNVYIADMANNRIRKVDASGIISTVGGNGTAGFSGDGAAAANAELTQPNGIIVDGSGNIYITDGGNNRIRMIGSTGVISTIGGNGTSGYSGDGAAATNAQINLPSGIAVDASGNVYFGDSFNGRVRRITKSNGIISTIAGNGTGGFSGDGGQATAAEFSGPVGVALDPAGNIYVADQGNSRIRKLIPSNLGINEIVENKNVSIYPNPNNGIFSVEFTGISGNARIQIYNITGQEVYKGSLSTKNSQINIGSQSAGLYLFKVTSEEGVLISTDKIIIQ